MKSAVGIDIEFDGDVILCAATCWTNGLISVPQIWCTQTKTSFEPLSKVFLEAFFESLWKYHEAGVVLLTWGGTGSDWPKLLKALGSDYEKKIKEMALASVDIPLVSVAANGMMMGLTSTALGMGLGNRPFCESEQVPSLWKSQNVIYQNEVVQHVQWDAWATTQIYNKLMFQIDYVRPQLSWMTQRSGLRSVRLQRHKDETTQMYTLPTVSQILNWSEPNAKFSIPDHLHPTKLTEWLR